MNPKTPDEIERGINESIADMLLGAVMMGSAASLIDSGKLSEETSKVGATDTLVAVCKKLAARVEGLIREGHCLAGSLYIVKKEGWVEKVSPHLLGAMEAKL